MLSRMQIRTIQSFRELHDWCEEFRLYHRKDGQGQKEGDDLMCATRYAVMMLRYASTSKSYRDFRRPLSYPKARWLEMRKFIMWHTSKSEWGTGSWAIIDGMVTVRTAFGPKQPKSAGRHLKPLRGY